MFIAGVVGCSALRRRAMCSLRWRQPLLFRVKIQIDMALLTEGESYCRFLL